MTLKRAEQIHRDMDAYSKADLQAAADRMREGHEAGTGSFHEVQWRGVVAEALQRAADLRES